VITLRKLQSLPTGTRDRKVLALLAVLRDRVAAGNLPLLADELAFYAAATELALPSSSRRGHPDNPTDLTDVRTLVRLIQTLETQLGLSIADWDLQAPRDREVADEVSPGQVPLPRFPLAVWLEDLRSPFNVGSILRTAEALGFEAVYLSEHCPPVNHPRVQRTAMGCAERLATATKTLAQLQQEWEGPVFALELGGTPLGEVAFPASGLWLVGSEELGLSPEALAWADKKSGRVTLPLYGRKASLNVGVAFGIAASAWAEAVNQKRTTSAG
jgi:TrmH family RNA methyltransferase